VQWRDALPAGALVGERYRILKPLASGGFGAVYEAEQVTTERRVALKILFRRKDDGSIERLLGEARVASRLTSEHVVQIIDAGVDLDTSAVFVAMELLSGVTLEELVQRHGPLSASESAELLRQIASGLDKAHGYVDRDGRPAPIVHRDLKPANVFVTRRDDGTALLKILDFGTAKLSSASAPSSRVVRGTPMYMAPEQISGERATPSADVWAFGLLGFFLLTGRSYWLSVAREAPTEALFAEILALPLASASARARELGATELAGLDAWFAATVNREPSARFTSAGRAAREFARALGVAVAPIPVPAVSDSVRPSPSVSTTAPVAARAFRAPPPEASPPRKSLTEELSALAQSSAAPRSRRLPLVLLGLATLLAGSAALFARFSDLRAPSDANAERSEASSPVLASTAAPEATPAPSAIAEPAERVENAVPAPPASAAPAGTPTQARKRSVKQPRGAPPAPAPSADRPKPSVYDIR
jgi:serine/threonine protein kinase